MTISPRKPDRTRHPTFYSAKCTAIGLCCFIALALPGCTTLPASAPADQAPATADTNVTHGAAPAGKDHADSVADEKPGTTVNDDHVIYFPTRVAIVDDAGKKKLRQHAEYLKQNPKTVVTLVGYVDDAGSRSYNLAITEQRILAVKQLLRTYGTPRKQIRRNSDKTQSKCVSAACKQNMRRVELVYTP